MRETSQSVGEMIAEALEQRGYGAKSALADAVGVRPQTVTKWIQGQTKPSPELRSGIEHHLRLLDGSIDAALESEMLDHSTMISTLTRRVAGLSELVESLIERIVAIERGDLDA